MARGCDLYFAEAVLTLRDAGELPDANLTAMLPCPSQAARWDAKTLDRYRQILARCDEVRVLEAEYSPGCMLRRNRAMVDAADVLLTVFDGSEGGTAATATPKGAAQRSCRFGSEVSLWWERADRVVRPCKCDRSDQEGIVNECMTPFCAAEQTSPPATSFL